jgi:hypothetical protein
MCQKITQYDSVIRLLWERIRMRRHYARSHSTLETVPNGRFYHFTMFEGEISQKHAPPSDDRNNLEFRHY